MHRVIITHQQQQKDSLGFKHDQTQEGGREGGRGHLLPDNVSRNYIRNAINPIQFYFGNIGFNLQVP